MIPISLQNTKTPLYRQIYIQIKEAIQSGSLSAHTRLLSKRKMAQLLDVSVNTVDTAYNQLVSEGFLEVRPQSGYYVCEIGKLEWDKNTKPLLKPVPMLESNPIKIDFSLFGVDKDHFPYTIWKRLSRNVFEQWKDTILKNSPCHGELELRKAIASYLYLSRGVLCHSEQIVVGAGTDNLLQILSYLLKNECIIAMENPVYYDAYFYFRRMGHQVVSIPTDHHGMQIEPLEKLINTAIYITPSHQFPLGITMPISRRIKLLNWAKQSEKRYIIEDDYDSEFRYDIQPIPSLQSIDKNEKVIYLGSFSRSIAPSLRISYMVLPEKLSEKFSEKYHAFPCAVSKLDQLILMQFLSKGHYETHLNKMRKLYKEKREFFVFALKKAFPNAEILGENAGQHVLLKMHEIKETELCVSAQKIGVRVYPISPYFTGKVPEKYKMVVLLGYAEPSCNQILEGVNLLQKAWNTF